MPIYKSGDYFQRSNSIEFDALYTPNSQAPKAGIYRCEGCGYEIGIAYGLMLPPLNHHTHTTPQRAIQWRLVARTSN
jgi:hypothetical protein